MEQENQKNGKQQNNSSGISHWLPIGICLGCSFGLLLDNLATGVGLGMLFGVALGTLFDSKKKEDKTTVNGQEDEPKIN